VYSLATTSFIKGLHVLTKNLDVFPFIELNPNAGQKFQEEISLLSYGAIQSNDHVTNTTKDTQIGDLDQRRAFLCASSFTVKLDMRKRVRLNLHLK
jgi:hypothetical protein